MNIIKKGKIYPSHHIGKAGAFCKYSCNFPLPPIIFMVAGGNEKLTFYSLPFLKRCIERNSL